MYMTREHAAETTRKTIEQMKRLAAERESMLPEWHEKALIVDLINDIDRSIMRAVTRGEWQCSVSFSVLSDVVVRTLVAKDPALSAYTYNIDIVHALLTLSWRNECD